MMSKLTKTLALTLAITLAIILVGSAAGASYSIMQTLLMNHRAGIRSNTDATLANIHIDAQAEIDTAMSAVVEHHRNRANNELQAYYNHKLESIATHPSVLAGMATVGTDTTALIAEEKARIDARIAALFDD